MQVSSKYHKKHFRLKFLNGTTIMELIIGIAISGMLLIGTISLIFALFVSNSRVTRLDAMEQVLNDIYGEFARTVRWAKSTSLPIDTGEGEFLQVIDADNSTITYKWTPATKKLLKDVLKEDGSESLNIPLTSSVINVVDLSIKNYSTIASVGSYEIIFTVEHQNLPNVSKSFQHVISQRYTAI